MAHRANRICDRSDAVGVKTAWCPIPPRMSTDDDVLVENHQGQPTAAYLRTNGHK